MDQAYGVFDDSDSSDSSQASAGAAGVVDTPSAESSFGMSSIGSAESGVEPAGVAREPHASAAATAPSPHAAVHTLPFSILDTTDSTTSSSDDEDTGAAPRDVDVTRISARSSHANLRISEDLIRACT